MPKAVAMGTRRGNIAAVGGAASVEDLRGVSSSAIQHPCESIPVVDVSTRGFQRVGETERRPVGGSIVGDVHIERKRIDAVDGQGSRREGHGRSVPALLA